MEVWYVDPGSIAGSPDGTTGHPYLSLQAALVAKCNKTFTEAIQIRCRTTGDKPADTTRVTDDALTQFVASAEYPLTICADTGHRASTFWDPTKYRLFPAYSTQAGTAILISEAYVRLDGLQIGISSQTAAAEIVYWSGASGVMSGCLVRGTNDTTYLTRGVSIIVGLTIIKSLFYALGTISAIVKNHGNSTFYNCTFIGGGGNLGVDINDGTCVAKNCYAGGSTNDYWVEAGHSLARTTCASSDATSGSVGLCSKPVNAANFKSVTTDDEDYAIPDVGSALYHAGTDTSTEDPPLDFTTDINGSTYYATTRSVGCDEFASRLVLVLRG